MKAFLMHRDRDFDPEAPLPVNADTLSQDVELTTLIDAMAGGDKFLWDTAKAALLQSLPDVQEITYRQDVLRDCQSQQQIVRELYDLSVEAITREKKVFGWMSDRYPAAILQHAIEVLEIFSQLLKILRSIAEEHRADFESEGFTRFFDMLMHELDDDYFRLIDQHLRQMRFKSGVLLSFQLDHGGKGTGLVLRRPNETRQTLGEKLSAFAHPALSFRIADRDEAGANALNELRGNGINLVADALARSTDHILSFFKMVRSELGFYIGCLNLQDVLEGKDQPIAFPTPTDSDAVVFHCRNLYDVSLALVSNGPAFGNDVSADGMPLIFVTGANRGGKSVFLRSVGLAQMMMQCGMFAPAEELTANVCTGVFTHFTREEDSSMNSGKLDEELRRMSEIADTVKPRALVLFNESFASTNEREGSEIGRQVIQALLASDIKVVFVTHQYDLAHSFVKDSTSTRFLRADRERTFKLVEGEPLTTSFGGDLYKRIFQEDPVKSTDAIEAAV
ncbi:MAG: hypothetical protein ABI400_02920 [Lacisediminihabitans sp.]